MPGPNEAGRTALLPITLSMMQKTAARTHFPPRMRWCVDNIWTNAPVAHLLPGLKQIADTLPPAPSHVLWLNWHPNRPRPDMAFSVEANRYLALYGEWKDAADDPQHDLGNPPHDADGSLQRGNPIRR